MTSPCSVPAVLRTLGLAPLETAAQQTACQWHDAAYARGGDRAARLRADLLLGLDLLTADMDPDLAELYVWGVRQYGGAHWPGGDGPGARLPSPDPPEAP